VSPAPAAMAPARDAPRRWVCSVLLGAPGGSRLDRSRPHGRDRAPPRPQPSPARPRTVSPPCHPPDAGAEGTRAPPPPPHAHPPITPAPPGAGPAVEAVGFSFFSTGMFLHAVHCVHASGRGCPRRPPPRGRPLPALPTVPHPTGQVLSLLENKSSLSVVPWGRGRRFVLRVGVRPGWGGGCHPVGTPGLSAPPPAPSLPGLCPCPEPVGCCWPGLSPCPGAALQTSVEPRALNYTAISL